MQQYLRRNDGPFLASKPIFMRWQMPYGKWTCPNGREVLDRDYTPICQRYPGGEVSKADPKERVNFNQEEWFYDDGCSERAKRKAAAAALAEWGWLEQCMADIDELISLSKQRCKQLGYRAVGF